MTAPERRLARGVVTRYAIGSVGTGGFATLPGLVLVFYLTDTLGVTALVAGLVVTAAKVWDVVVDPWIGERSDRALARTGTRRTWMRVGAIALPFAFAATFALLISLSTPTFVLTKTLLSLGITCAAIVLTVSWAIRTARAENLVLAPLATGCSGPRPRAPGVPG